MKSSSSKAFGSLYVLAAFLLPITAILLALYVNNMQNISKEYKMTYDIAINITATGITVLITTLFLEKANSIKLVNLISDSISDKDLQLTRTIKKLFRDIFDENENSSNIEIFEDEISAYNALVDDIKEGEVNIVNSIFVTDDPTGKYQIDNKGIKDEWLNTIKDRLANKKGKNKDKFSITVIESPKDGAKIFVDNIGGKENIRNSGGNIYSINIVEQQQKYMINFVLINKKFELHHSYIVYLGWIGRINNTFEYKSPCIRIDCEKLFKYLQTTYCDMLIASANMSE